MPWMSLLYTLPMLCLSACEQVDFRPECAWTIDVVETDGLSLDLGYGTFSCTPPETAPDGLMVEAVSADGGPYAGDDLEVVCDSANHYTALQVWGLAEGSHAYQPFQEGQPGEITFEDRTRVGPQSWVHVTYLEQLEDGSQTSEEAWAAFVQQGPNGRVVPARDCYER